MRLTVRRNYLLNNGVGPGGECVGGSITFRGVMDQTLIEENTIVGSTYDEGCGGISSNEGYGSTETMSRLVIRGNTIVGCYGGLGAIAINLAPNTIIENNRIINNISGEATCYGINVGANGSPQGDSQADSVIVRNNTVYTLYSGSPGISIPSRTGHSVFNNLVYMGASSTGNCFAHGAIGIYTVWDYNHCDRDGSGNWSSTYTTLANAQAASFDTNGSEGDPLFNNTPSSGNSWDLSVQAGSPVVSTGRNTGKPPRDVLLCQRDSTPDKGAHERGGTPCLTVRAPINVR